MENQEIIDTLRAAVWDAGIELSEKQEIDQWLTKKEKTTSHIPNCGSCGEPIEPEASCYAVQSGYICRARCPIPTIPYWMHLRR